jgi:hypothetical protein
MSLPRTPKTGSALPKDLEPEVLATAPDEPAGVPRLFHERLDNWKTIGELASEIIRQLRVVK